MPYRKSTDHNQREIVAALKAAGWRVYDIGRPVDLLIKRGRVIGTIEVKNPEGRDRPQPSQEEFHRDGGNCGYARSAEEAIRLAEGFS